MKNCCPRCHGEELVISNLVELPDIILCMACGARVELEALECAPVTPRRSAIRMPAD